MQLIEGLLSANVPFFTCLRSHLRRQRHTQASFPCDPLPRFRPGRCTGRTTGPTCPSKVLSDTTEADEDVLPFMAWTSRFTALRGLCQTFSTGSNFRQRTGHPETASFLRLAIRLMNLLSTRRLVPGETCTSAWLAEASTTFIGPVDGRDADVTPWFLCTKKPLRATWAK